MPVSISCLALRTRASKSGLRSAVAGRHQGGMVPVKMLLLMLCLWAESMYFVYEK